MFIKIIAVVVCAPVWLLCLYGMGNVMEAILDRIAPLENAGCFAYLLGGLISLIVSIVVPVFFMALGVGAWVIVKLIFGLW